MIASRPLSLTRAVTIQLTTLTHNAPSRADQNPATWKPVTTQETSHRQSPFSTNRNRPSVINVIGSVRTSRTGRTTALTIPSNTPAATVGSTPSSLMPGTTEAAAASARMLTSTRSRKPIQGTSRRAVYYTRAIVTGTWGLLLLTTVMAAVQFAWAPDASAQTGAPFTIVPAMTKG